MGVGSQLRRSGKKSFGIVRIHDDTRAGADNRASREIIPRRRQQDRPSRA
jgi:hypothetical protein